FFVGLNKSLSPLKIFIKICLIKKEKYPGSKY
ncbi:MAG: hypothetical protein ACI9BD_001076, partial [Candidatus Marinamargulisbacteria bacterium]